MFQGGAVQLSEDTILVVFPRSRLYRLVKRLLFKMASTVKMAWAVCNRKEKLPRRQRRKKESDTKASRMQVV